MRKIVAIHQPNFFPWLGYFDKIRRADLFVVLDDVQFPKSGSGVWSNRVKILQNGKAHWLTAPIDRNFSGMRTMREMQFSKHEDWRGKLQKTLQNAYARAPFFDQTMALIAPLLANPDDNLAAYNLRSLTALCEALGFDTKKIVLSSTLDVAVAATERLIALTQAAQGTDYLCGGGAEGYQEDTLFKQANLELIYQSFQCLPYAQKGAEAFVPGLSIIDALMQIGLSGLIDLMNDSAGAPAVKRA